MPKPIICLFDALRQFLADQATGYPTLFSEGSLRVLHRAGRILDWKSAFVGASRQASAKADPRPEVQKGVTTSPRDGPWPLGLFEPPWGFAV
ncbi:MAG: hypothetical protein ACPLYD_14975, partial [Anaerolineae bacterium]